MRHAGPPSDWLPAWRPDPAAPLDQLLGTFALWALVAIMVRAGLGIGFHAFALLTGHAELSRTAARMTPRWYRRAAERLAATVVGFTLLGTAGPVLAVADVPAEASETTNPQGPDHPHPGLNRLARSRQHSTDAQMVTPARGPEPLRADHQVMRGDNLWNIAAGRLAAHPDHSLTVREYWLLVIDANRDRLRSGDPDLIFPGETIVLPPLGEPS